MKKETCTKKIDTRVTAKMHEALTVKADEQNRSLSAYVKTLFDKAIKVKKKKVK